MERRGIRSEPETTNDNKVSDITYLLEEFDAGDRNAADRLLERVYDELRSLAAAKLAREKGPQTLQATALVHDAWLRLGGDDQEAWRNRAHFFGAAAEAMRRILIDRARRKQAARHGGGVAPIPLDDIEIPGPSDFNEDALAVHEVLERFSKEHPKKAALVKLRFFVGLTNEQAADALDIATPTAKRWWKYAKAWLRVEMTSGSA